MPGSVGSPYSELAIEYVHLREVAEALDDLPLRHSGAETIFFGSVMPSVVQRLGQVHAAGGVGVRDHHVGRRRASRREHRGQVGLALRVADAT